MRQEAGWIAAAFLAALSCRVDAQTDKGRPDQADPPEALSGAWETPDGHGGAVGIHLQLLIQGTNALEHAPVSQMSSTEPDAAHSNRTFEYWVYARKGDVLELNSFSDSAGEARVTFQDGRMRLHYVSTWKGAPSVDLDLTKTGDTWIGRLHRGEFDGDVTLRRPAADGTGRQDPVVGLWVDGSSGNGTCLHVAESAPGIFLGWSDSINPGHTVSSYGELMKVKRLEDGRYSFELGAYAGLCCSSTVTGKLSQDGAGIAGEWRGGDLQEVNANESSPGKPVTWRRAAGDSCSDALTGRKEHGFAR